MTERSLYTNLMLLGSGIEVCIDKKLTGPALILIYSAIDTAGWLDSDDDFATKSSFMTWTEDYLLRAKPLKCTSLDLYAARCGLLHTFTPDSKLSTGKQARRICYAYGSGNVQDLECAIEGTNKTGEYVAVHVNDIYEGWRLGVGMFTEDIENDPAKKLKVHEKARRFFSKLDPEMLSRVLEKFDNNNET